MGYLVCFLLGVIVALVLAEYLPPDIGIRLNKIKLKNSDDNQLEIPLNIERKKKPGLFRKIFKRKKA